MNPIVYVIERDGKYYKVGSYRNKPIIWVKDYYKATYFDTYKEAEKENNTMKLNGNITRYI